MAGALPIEAEAVDMRFNKARKSRAPGKRLRAALSFLSSLTTAREKEARAAAERGGLFSGEGAGDGDGYVEGGEEEEEERLGGGQAPVSIRVRGRRNFHMVHGVASELRRPGDTPAVRLRQARLRDGVSRARIFFTSAKGYPAAVFSVLPYSSEVESLRTGARLSAGVGELDGPLTSAAEPAWMRWKGKSYKALLHVTWRNRPHRRRRWKGPAGPLPLVDAGRTSGSDSGGERVAPRGDDDRRYDPNLLDDPRFARNTISSTHRLQGYVVSIVKYAPEKQRKAEINALFREQFPWVHASLTLSQILSVKRRALEWARKLDCGTQQTGLEVGTVALAHVCFEKLVLSRVVNKANRRLVMCACLLLAAKFNEAKGGAAMADDGDGGATDWGDTGAVGHGAGGHEARSGGSGAAVALLASCSREMGVSREELLKAEWPVFAHLDFELHVPPVDARPHFHRLLGQLGESVVDYLGPESFKLYYPAGDPTDLGGDSDAAGSSSSDEDSGARASVLTVGGSRDRSRSGSRASPFSLADDISFRSRSRSGTRSRSRSRSRSVRRDSASPSPSPPGSRGDRGSTAAADAGTAR